MRRHGTWMALASLATLAGCAQPVPHQAVATVPSRGGAAARPAGVVACSTTSLVLATLSQCGEGGMRFGIATE